MTAVLEDAGNTTDPVQAQAIMDEAKADGYNTVIETETWQPGTVVPRPDDLAAAEVSITAAQKDGLQVMMRIIPDWRDNQANLHMPTGASDDRFFVHYVVAYAGDLPTVNDWAIGNEPNTNYFWSPQYTNGAPAAPAAYERLLSKLYYPLKQEGVARGNPVTIVAGEFAAGGSNDPTAKKVGISPPNFLRLMGVAYQAGTYTGPLFDKLSFHTYPENNADPPDAQYADGTISLAGALAMRFALRQSFANTGQSTEVPLFDSEDGEYTVIPPSKANMYKATKQPGGVSEATQGAYYTSKLKMAYCSDAGIDGYTVFHVRDEAKSWRTGLRDVAGNPKSDEPAVASQLKLAASGTLSCD